MIRLLLILAAGTIASRPVIAATLRPFGTLAGATVAVSDLWDDAGAAAPTVLGPAPALGERIVVEAAQLAAIARQFGVDWRPSSAAARSVLERPGRPLPQERVEQALRAWLPVAGPIEFSNFRPPMVARDAELTVTVERGSCDPDGGRFEVDLGVVAAGAEPHALHVAGRVVQATPVLVATHRLQPGAALRPQDTTVTPLARDRAPDRAATAPEQATGLVLRRALASGEPVLLADLAPALVVSKGERVAIAVEAAGVALSASGEALQAGAVGEQIPVRNPTSRAVLLATVTGPGAVRVQPGSLPLPPKKNLGVP